MGYTAMTKEVPARGARKSIVAQYKAKAKNISGSSSSKKKPSPVKRKKNIVEKKEQLMEMTLDEKVFAVGDVGWYVCEYNASPSRPKTNHGELTAVYPEDNTAPAVGLVDHETGKYRVIRAQLIGWSKKEALENYHEFLKAKNKQ
jgi:hypothetical protein